MPNDTTDEFTTMQAAFVFFLLNASLETFQVAVLELALNSDYNTFEALLALHRFPTAGICTFAHFGTFWLQSNT